MMDPEYHIVFCSVECQLKYHLHKQDGVNVDDDENGDAFRELWRLHVSLTRQFIMEMVRNDENTDLDGIVKQLMENQVDIGNMFKIAYGDEFGDAVTKLLQDHIVLAKKVMSELMLKPGIDSDTYKAENVYYDEWFEQAQSIGQALYDKMGDRPVVMNDEPVKPTTGTRDQFLTFMKEHIEMTLEEMIAEVNGQDVRSLEVYAVVLSDIVAFADFLLSFRSDTMKSINIITTTTEASTRTLLIKGGGGGSPNEAYRNVWRLGASLLRQLMQERVSENIDTEVGETIMQELGENAILIAEGADLDRKGMEGIKEWIEALEILIDIVKLRKNRINGQLTMEALKLDNDPYRQWSKLCEQLAEILDIHDIKMVDYKKAILEELLAFINDEPEQVEVAHKKLVKLSIELADHIVK